MKSPIKFTFSYTSLIFFLLKALLDIYLQPETIRQKHKETLTLSIYSVKKGTNN